MQLELKYGNKYYVVAKPGHLLLFSGPPSVGKSKLIEPLMASFLHQKGVCSMFKWKGISKGKKILLVDTEQPEDLLQSSLDRIQELSGIKTTKEFKERVTVLQLVSIPSNKDKLNTFKQHIKEFGNDYALIIPDNMSGLITSMNSEVEGTEFSNYLNSVCDNYQLIMLVLSHVSGEGTAIGHTGKAVQRLASLSSKLSKDEDSGVTIVTKDKCRLTPNLPHFHFKVDQLTGEVIEGVYMPFP